MDKMKKDWKSKERDYYKENRILKTQNRLLQKVLDAIKVSADYIHQVCSTIRSCYLWPIRGSCECKFTPVLLGEILKF
jgi:hypothetical protein